MPQPAPEDVYVLSPMQQGLLFHSLYAPDEQLYVDQLILEIEARLEPELLAAAWQRVVARHPALRTSFHWQGLDKPLQVVHREVTVPFAAHDCRGEPRRRVEELLEEIRRRGFQLGRPPLLRLDWVWTGEARGLLAWTYHHILLDAWSASVVLAEVTAVYQALAGGGEAELPPVRRFADYIAWLRRRDAAADEAFWRSRLAGFRVPTPLFMERHAANGSAAGNGAHGERGLALEREVSGALAGFARRHQLTLNTLVQGAWAALLHRTSGEPEVLFGATVSGRPAEVPGIESMVGLFINTLPIRTRWPDATDTVSWLREVQAWQLAVQPHAYDPLAEIQRWSEVPAGRPLFDSIVVFENVPEMSRGPAPDGTLALRGQRYVSRTHYPLSLLVVPGDQLTLRATFERRRLEDTAVARQLAHLANLLGGLAGLASLVPGTPAPPLGALPLLSAAERHQLLREWQDRPLGPPVGAPLRPSRPPAGAAGLLHRLVEERARATPEAVALVEAETGLSLTYAELDRRTARLAHLLRALGIGPEVPVVAAVERGAAAVVALLAVLAADGVYVPVEPAVPAARLAFVLADTGAPVVLGGPRLELPPLSPPESPPGPAPGTSTRQAARERPPLRLDPASPAPPAGEQESGEQAAATGPAGLPALPRVAPEGLAYVIYTSGSTGVPKGVAVTHQAAAAHFAAVAGEYGIEPGERVLQFASFAFDAGLEQVFTCLLRGATLVLRGEEVWDTADLDARLARLRIGVANLPTSYWASWAEALARPAGADAGAAQPSTAAAAERLGGKPRELRLLIAGGEAMPASALAAWHGSALAGVRLLNAYGPTEALVTATLHPLPGPQGGSVPLGRPLAGRTAYVLDRGLEPLPAGAPGELCLGGRLARGYLGRPDLTAASFVPDPFGGPAGSRLYRTGDRVRLLPDGRLQFLGRIDRQLKVRGVRVEPGEIEAALALHPGVAEAAVLTHDGGGGPVLVAFVVPRPGARLTAAELRDDLRRRLPAAWIPAAFALLERPARTAGGKLDRRALPSWDAAAARGAPRQAPRNPVEELLASLWSAVLGVPAVGIHDDFFAAGGHSLLAMRLLSRVREAFAVELPLASLFAAPTVAGQAERVLAALAGQDGLAGEAAGDVGGGPRSADPRSIAPPPLRPAPRDAPLPLSFAQQRLWILDQFDPGLPAYNIPVALRLAGTLSPGAMAAALTALAARHEPLRTRFEVADERPVQRIDPAGPVPLPVADLRRLPPARRQAELLALARQDAVRRFALGRGPLLRAGLVLLGAADQALLLAVHHIAADAWSIGILLAELAELYGAAAGARPAALPPLPVQYADYAVWQRAWLDGPALERQLAFWRERLAGLPAGVPLPIDRPRPPLQTYRGARLPVRLDAAAAARARELAGSERATLFMALLAACAELLARYSGHADLAIGTPVANRGRLETEGLIGFFVNTLVLRLSLAGNPTVRQLVARAREATIVSTVHQEVPFEKLVEELRPERSLALTPFFQVLFTLDNPPPVPELPGLAAEPLAVESGTAKFDLTLALSDLVEAGETGAAGAPGGAAAPARRTRRTLAGGLEFNADLFDPATAARLAGHFANLVAAFAANPERPAASLPLLAASERHQLLVEWNDTPPPPPRDASLGEGAPLHRRFERQAAATPGAAALIAGGESLTYRELDRHATRLARRLVRMGVGPEVTAAIFLERTPELIVALLAVLKAGGAYVPLDPAYPQERLATTLADCGAPVVLTQEWLADRLPATAARQVLLGAFSEDGAEDQPQDESEHGPGDEPDLEPAALDTLAYLIYTSGSTGHPKGVAITHRAAGAFLDWALARFGPAELATVFASTSICFDLSVFEIFAPLAAGGRVHLAGSGLDLLALGEADRVTLVNTVPSLLAEVVSRGLPASVRTLNLAGEPIPLALAERLAAIPTLERVWNLYGPSEVTTYATAGALAAADLAAGRQPPIGRPIAGITAYLLDGAMRAVPVGAPGELHLGGRGLARGYHRRPGLTAAAFIPNPLGDPGSRLYRTGDLARALPDGRLEFLGRRDAQVKVRGFRIEPGEIEAALARHPDVAQAVVVPRPDGTAAGREQRLVAYVVAPPGRRAGTADELRAFLRRSLPDFMIPAAFVEMGTVPLLPNGKVDRAALPSPETARRPAAGAVEPRTDLERTIAAVLAEVLGVDRLVLDENFFDLGGHSLAMIRAAGILEQRLGRTLPVLDLFRFPTVAALAGHLGGGAPASPGGAAQGGEDPGANRQPDRQPGRRRRREARSELDPVGR